MTEALGPSILCLLAGGAFGLLYMGVLWGAVRVLASGRSVWLFAAMGLLRALLLGGTLWLAVRTDATAAQIAFALLGFIVVRLLATRMARTARPERISWK